MRNLQGIHINDFVVIKWSEEHIALRKQNNYFFELIKKQKTSEQQRTNYKKKEIEQDFIDSLSPTDKILFDIEQLLSKKNDILLSQTKKIKLNESTQNVSSQINADNHE